MKGLIEATTIISTRRNVLWDYPVVRALAAGCWPILPFSGMYTELIPEPLQSVCLYDGRPEMLASKLQDVWHLNTPAGNEKDFEPMLKNAAPPRRAKQWMNASNNWSSPTRFESKDEG